MGESGWWASVQWLQKYREDDQPVGERALVGLRQVQETSARECKANTGSDGGRGKEKSKSEAEARETEGSPKEKGENRGPRCPRTVSGDEHDVEGAAARSQGLLLPLPCALAAWDTMHPADVLAEPSSS